MEGNPVKRLVCLSALAVSLAAFAQAPSGGAKKPLPPSEKGRAEQGVNWQGQVLKATGSGAPNLKSSSPAQARIGAEKAAKLDALRNLLEQAKGIQISAGKKVGDELEKSEVRAKVEGVIKGYTVTDTRYFSDNGVEIDVEVPLSAITSVLVPSETQIALNQSGKAEHSGVVVDATGLKVIPALAPRLLDESGKALYAADCLNEEARQSHGVASYFKSVADAQKSAVVGKKPLVLKAARVDGSDVVLTAESAKLLAAVNQSFLAEGRVAIVSN
jgi:hypothetical protein